MGIRKEIEIDGKMVAFKASAAIPRIYRLKFQRDIFIKIWPRWRKVLVMEMQRHLIWICSR